MICSNLPFMPLQLNCSIFRLYFLVTLALLKFGFGLARGLDGGLVEGVGVWWSSVEEVVFEGWGVVGLD